uniref:Polyamine ABC transporter substrate binding protein n=1 Tax=Papaver somniferum TaxID=3469 RepID=A0A5B7LL97_PAPSO|nr:polyamine ABC transporter substrate binding protein [Papaver somniferum]
MEAVGDDHSVTSPEKSFEVNKPEEAGAHEEVMAKVDLPLREFGRAIQGMSIMHLRIARGRICALSAAIDMEEQWRRDEALRVLTSARSERFAARLKRRRVEHKWTLGGDKCDYPIHDGVIILDSDTDEPERMKVINTLANAAVALGEDVEAVFVDVVEEDSVAAEISEVEAEADP